MSTKDASQEICIPVVFAAASVILYLSASRCALSVFACDFSPDMNFHDMCVSPCSPATDYDDDQLLGRVEPKILCPPGISFHTLVSAGVCRDGAICTPWQSGADDDLVAALFQSRD